MNLVWLRNDLRLDNSTFHAALNNQDKVMAVYCMTPKTWERHNDAPIKIDFIKKHLEALKQELAHHHIPFEILALNEFADCVPALLSLVTKRDIKAVYFNEQYEFDERRRDEAVMKALQGQGIKVNTFHDNVIVPPGMVMSGSGQPIKVFTPFKKKWLQWVDQIPYLKTESKAPWSPKITKSDKMDEGKQLLYHFCHHGLHDYHLKRDYPALNATSRLSPYLTQGILSPRQCLQALFDATNTDSLGALLKNKGAESWLNEFIWREFYQHLAYFFPRLCQYHAFQEKYEHLTWDNNKIWFKAWCEGRTGFPIVDAAMRQMNTTGWMHNRLRMVSAMFLCKILLIDWHWGERYFMSRLIDGDFAANNGGWQWCASTGTDAAPYFRIFNPTLQSEKFDPKGDFIRQYCPELKAFDAKAIHAPHARNPELAKKVDYPAPIIDYKIQRQKALQLYRQNIII